MALLNMDPQGERLSGSTSVAVAFVMNVFEYGLVTAEMGSTTKLIFLTHGQADVCFWLFFQEHKWALPNHPQVVSPVFGIITPNCDMIGSNSGGGW